MTTSKEPQRTLFTFRRSGDTNGKRLVEITAEPLEHHETPAGVAKQSWFGAEDDITTTLESLKSSTIDVEGVIGALHTNRDATREVDTLASDLTQGGFSRSA